jgi:hypothetical protein
MNNYDLNAYISNINFRNEKGFIEILKIILDMIKKINDVANIDIDYDGLSSYLFKNYRGVSTRYEKYLKEFESKNKDDATKYATKYSEMIPKHLQSSKYVDKIHLDIVKNVNEKFIETINTIFYNSICFWVIDAQEKILNNSISLNMNYLNPNHIDKLNIRGLLYYIIEIISDFFKYTDTNDYVINIKELKKNLIYIIQNEYKNKDDNVLNELLNKNNENFKCKNDKYKGIDDERYYIDKLLFTPSNNSKYEKIHKYIQGCCLRKLDNNFNDISDFEFANNTEIIKLKELYSKIKLINKKRDIRFTPPKLIKKKGSKKDKDKENKKDNDIDDDIIFDDSEGNNDIYMNENKENYNNIKYVNSKQYIYNINNYKVIEWLESMRNVSEILPNSLIDHLINSEIDDINTVITDNIKKLKKVKKNINTDFLDCKYINYKEILLNICKLLYVNINSSSKYNDNELLKEKIMSSIKEIKNMIKYLYKLNKITYYNDNDADNIDTINKLIISKSFNFPDLSEIENIPNDFIYYNANEMYEYLKNYLDGKYNRFLTPKEIDEFINEKREEYKNKKLEEYKHLNEDEHEIRRQIKAAGIIKDIYDDGDIDTVDKAVDIDDDYKDEEKDDDYNNKDNDNFNTYNDNDIDSD